MTVDPPASAPALEVEHVRFGYGDLTVIWDVSLRAFAGTITALLGRNGAGKTTIISGIAGLIPTRHGSVRLGGQDIGRRPPWKRVALGLGVVQEGKRIIRPFTVEENLRLGLYGTRLRAPAVHERLEELFTRFEILGRRRHQLAGELSGGQQQLLAIAQAVIRRPAVLLVDEPSAGLSPVALDEILVVLDELKRGGMAIVLVEQRVDDVLNGVADWVALVEGGRVVRSGAASEITSDELTTEIFQMTSIR